MLLGHVIPFWKGFDEANRSVHVNLGPEAELWVLKGGLEGGNFFGEFCNFG